MQFPDGRTWQDYVNENRLEITCGEAPYIVSRYDVATGEPIPIDRRIGLLDRKLRVVSENTDKAQDWRDWAYKALHSVYGFEWQGDSLLIARENALMTFVDNFVDKFRKLPEKASVKSAAHIVSWNLWQMDGLKGVVPDSCHPDVGIEGWESGHQCPGCEKGEIRLHNGIYCLVRDWRAKKKSKDDRRCVRFIDINKNS